MTAIDSLILALTGLCCALVVVAGRMASDIALWRNEARDMRQLWNWERDQSKWLRAALEDERKRHREGVYR